ncbi:MAG: PilZ domain-containing protein [Planctomycetota bacterium]
MGPSSRIIPRLAEAARSRAEMRILQAEHSGLEGLEGTLAECGPFGSLPLALRWEIRRGTGAAQPELGEFLEAQLEIAGEELSFGTLVLAHERKGAAMSLWTTVPEELRVTERRRYQRVLPGRRILISVVLGAGTDPERTLATDGGDFHHTGILRNISNGGLKVMFPPEVLSGMHVADAVTVSLRLPDELEELTLAGRIRYLRRRTNSQTISCGVDFGEETQTQGARARIASFVCAERKKRALTASDLRFW